MDFNKVTSKVSEEVSNTASSSNKQLVLQDFQSMYFTRVLLVVQNLTSLETSNAFQINKLQCEYLCVKLCESMNDVYIYIQDLMRQDGIRSTQNILKKLWQVAKDGEILVQGCRSNQWIQTAIIFADAKEHFASLVLKVELYMALLQNNLNEQIKRMFLSNFQDWSNEVSIKNCRLLMRRQIGIK